ncbi:MAG: Hsp33 family molecular chaperone HslO [Kiritimatiellae bacterium]|jgi:molecular chaperone Hsp33|nr:Hsp33 family molecular chaperone HslO [Kiritimatiellia bacterium]
MKQTITDNRQTALTKLKLLLTYVDITNSAKELERSHLSGPTAGLVQSDALAAVALLGAEFSQKDEAISLRFRVSGPVAGLLVETTFEGGLRGYTHNKILNDLDARETITDEDALGELAQMTVVRSIPGKTLSNAMIDIHPASIRDGLHEYLNKSLQRKADVNIAVKSTVEGVTYAKAFMIECMPDGDLNAFKKLTAKIKDGSLKKKLVKACNLEDLCSLLKIDDYKLNDVQPLKFKCRCSAERVEAMVNGLPDDDIKDMLKSSEEIQIVCHMCGNGFRVGKSLLWSVLEKRGHDLEFEEDLTND